jgi:hypothetical protein
MAEEEPSRKCAPAFICRLCRQEIGEADKSVLVGLSAAHATCLERSATDDLTDVERSRLIGLCWDHPVAVCDACSRGYRITGMGSDMVIGRYWLCLSCRADLVWSIRQHIATCAVVRQNDPVWQEDVREVLAKAREMGQSQLLNASELIMIESEILRSKARQTTDVARLAQKKSRRIKRSGPPPGK